MPEYLKSGREAGTTTDPAVQARVAEMLGDISARGETAVRDFSRALDHHDPPSFRISDDTINAAIRHVAPELRAHIDAAHASVGAFARAQLACLQPLEVEIAPGQVLGHRLLPVRSVGAYIPGGRYPLISSALMSILTAKTAGVEKVVAMTAPTPEGGIHPPTLYAMHTAGADEIYALGGVQALGALAYGALKGLEPVDMIVGAGNAFVAEAKRQLFGRVGIDLLAGPTEVLVIADDTADARTVAIDLLAQAEHGPTSPAVLITTSRALGMAVLEHIPAIVDSWPTGDVAGQAWADLGVVAVVDSPEEAVELSDAYASEHLQLQVADTVWYEERLRNYGTVFSGEETTVAYGDKATGTNHTLPTNGAARYTGGLWVGSFIRVCTFQRLSPEASVRVGRHTSAISTAERMFGHAASADIRVEKYRRPMINI
ncbi:histidinol dehydrogenase [Tessaracoccus antarcticus]|uniref:Histidinol dehydrogenase n=1 Tax=Tessaracoccus antarcticus TaxID=2479848 RepID=A0A3M0GBB3_9ACTN|nr:histidinol dehydrogenase [Tessaracoccus antarcticus]RMB59822.1 histidinol dehydrogenase [Tessaracoccus antarcticus]